MKTICGIDCTACGWKENCKGCAETNGHPFGGECVVAECYKSGGENGYLTYKNRLIEDFNALGVIDMPTVTNLCQLNGAYVNLEYTLPSGKKSDYLMTRKYISVISLKKKIAIDATDLLQTIIFCLSANMVAMVQTPKSLYIKRGN